MKSGVSGTPNFNGIVGKRTPDSTFKSKIEEVNLILFSFFINCNFSKDKWRKL